MNRIEQVRLAMMVMNTAKIKPETLEEVTIEYIDLD